MNEYSTNFLPDDRTRERKRGTNATPERIVVCQSLLWWMVVLTGVGFPSRGRQSAVSVPGLPYQRFLPFHLG